MTQRRRTQSENAKVLDSNDERAINKRVDDILSDEGGNDTRR